MKQQTKFGFNPKFYKWFILEMEDFSDENNEPRFKEITYNTYCLWLWQEKFTHLSFETAQALFVYDIIFRSKELLDEFKQSILLAVILLDSEKLVNTEN